MLSLSLPVGVYLYTEPTDMRKGFDGLLQLASEHLARDPLAGGLYVFVNRRRDRIKLLYWDTDGLVVWYKRLEAGTFELPRTDGARAVLTPTELAMLLGGVELAAGRRRRYQREKKS